jgi:CheY-like chemotaxis protein
MDINMPVLDGYGATAQIRAWEKDQQRQPVPIIALSADAFPEDEARCRQVGVSDFLAKPVNADVLAATLARWLPATPS